MKIKKISSDCFAGVLNLDVSLNDGINVIYGKNESGKSTLVNLLSRTLFQSKDLNLTRKSDKSFVELYMPVARKGGTDIKSIDGKVVIETENSTYTLKKEWGEDPRCQLITPDGPVRDQERIDQILRTILCYGEGVYSEMLFSSQRNTDRSLQTILDSSQPTDAKQEITAAVTKAFAESDGLSVDAIEQAINEKIDKVLGQNWEISKNAPKKRANGARWVKDIGEILKAYYALEDAQKILDEITELENKAYSASVEYENKITEADRAEEEYNKFDWFASRLVVQNALNDKLNALNSDIKKFTEDLNDWPIYAGQLHKAKALHAEKLNRELLDTYTVAKRLSDELSALKDLQNKLQVPAQQEILDVKAAQKQLNSLKNRLCGMNLAATVKMLGGNSVEIRSVSDGKLIDISDDSVSITEAVKITVPGVLEMQLSPANVDVDSVKAQIAEQNDIICSVFGKYSAESVEALEALLRQYNDTKSKIETCESRLVILLGATPFEELEKSAAALPEYVRDREQIDSEIAAVCKGEDVLRFISKREAIIDGYIKSYGNVESLNNRLHQATADRETTQKSVSAGENIPDQYLNIKNPEAHKNLLQATLKLKQKERDDALKNKAEITSKLDTYKENFDGDPVANKEAAEIKFNEQKTLLAHWLHISEVFQMQKASISINPMQDISDSFTKYLGIISGGNVSSEFTEQNNLNMNIYSNSRPLDYGKLSEGTKETVSLAFRLAVLDHLFPEGGGVIVLDDPFTDMDAIRTEQACKLLKECALRHQVIFLTCKEECAAMLGGATVNFE